MLDTAVGRLRQAFGRSKRLDVDQVSATADLVQIDLLEDPLDGQTEYIDVESERAFEIGHSQNDMIDAVELGRNCHFALAFDLVRKAYRAASSGRNRCSSENEFRFSDVRRPVHAKNAVAIGFSLTVSVAQNPQTSL